MSVTLQIFGKQYRQNSRLKWET